MPRYFVDLELSAYRCDALVGQEAIPMTQPHAEKPEMMDASFPLPVQA
jgi:hypothetical protein